MPISQTLVHQSDCVLKIEIRSSKPRKRPLIISGDCSITSGPSFRSNPENQVRVFGALPIEKCFDLKVGMENKKKKKPWWTSVVARGRDKLRREKMRLKKANVKDLFAQFWNREEEFEWKIEHKQDPYAFLSLPVSTPFRVLS